VEEYKSVHSSGMNGVSAVDPSKVPRRRSSCHTSQCVAKFVAGNLLRWLPAVACVLQVLGIWDADSRLTSAWHAVKTTDFAKRPMAEAYVAALSFGVWIILFSFADLIPGLEGCRVNRFSRDAKPAHISLAVIAMISATFVAIGEPVGRVVPLVVGLALVFLMYMMGSITVIKAYQGMFQYIQRIYATFFVYLGAIALIHSMKDPRPADDGHIGLSRLVTEVGFGVVAYDFVFSWIHVGMHRLFPRACHDHHQHHIMNSFCGRVLALDTVNHGLLDGSLQVMVNILVQNIGILGMPKHKFSRFIHNILVTGLLVESHAGYDCFWSTHNLFPGIFGGTKRHMAHHMNGKSYYQQFFCYLDDWVFSHLA